MTFRDLGGNAREVQIGERTILFSYATPVALHDGTRYYRTSKTWSKTTSRHINAWLAGADAEERPQEFFDNQT